MAALLQDVLERQTGAHKLHAAGVHGLEEQPAGAGGVGQFYERPETCPVFNNKSAPRPETNLSVSF